MKSQGDLGQETELAALERQRRGKKKGASQKKNKSQTVNLLTVNKLYLQRQTAVRIE